MDITRGSLSDAADKFADKERRMGIWEVWAKYGIRSRKDGQRYVLAVERDESELPPAPDKRDLEKALEETGGRVDWDSTADALMRQAVERREVRKEEGEYSKDRVYWPLVRHPDLFLRFARLADEGKLDNAGTVEELDTDKNAATAKEWAETYGVLGLGTSTRGGKADTVAAFAHEAWVANGCLLLYEAARAEVLDVDLIASHIGNARHKSLYILTPALTREWALNAVASETQEKVAGNVYPALYGEVGRFVQGWSFTNLLGAIWLQMFWLLTATKAPRRCGECDKIIAYEQPDQAQGVKKRGRKKEKFCDKTCSDRYVYRTKTKPRRQAARAV